MTQYLRLGTFRAILGAGLECLHEEAEVELLPLLELLFERCGGEWGPAEQDDWARAVKAVMGAIEADVGNRIDLAVEPRDGAS